MIKGVKHVTIAVKDQDRALKFYTEKLGFKLLVDASMGEGMQRWIELEIPGAQTQTLRSAEPGLRTVMIGRSTFQDSSEIVWVVTRMYYQSLFYIVCVAPEEEFTRDFQATFEQIIRSIQLR